jgi:hypothetical protein
MLVAFDDNAGEAVAEEMSFATVPAVEKPCAGAVELLDSLRQTLLGTCTRRW